MPNKDLEDVDIALVKFPEAGQEVYMEKKKAVKFVVGYDDVTMEVQN